MPTYQRLTSAEREEISIGMGRGDSSAEIARRLNRATSTVTREVGGSPGEYRAWLAIQRSVTRVASRRRGKSKIAASPELREYVLSRLAEKWSPEQIAMSLKERYPEDMAMRVSDESIYRYIYVLPRGELKRTLIKALRHEHKYRRKATRATGTPAETRGKIAEMLSIDERPAEVADRVMPGHWEGDLIVGRRNQSAVGTLVERTTRYTVIVPLAGKDAETVREAFAKEVGALPRELAKTLTYDQGKEMSGHRQFTLATGMQVYFAHPASPWERGTNENTNGLIRQYFPKGTDFRSVSTREIKAAQRSLNGRPRKTLGFKTPNEAFNSLLR
jgi:transposase, IS30 family